MIGLGYSMARAARRKVAATYTGPVFDFLTPSVSTQEGNSGTTIMGFVVQRFGSLAGTDDLNYAVSGYGVNAAQTSNFPGGVMPSGTVTFSPADTSKTIYIVVQTNTSYDVDRDFILTISGQSHILNPVAFGTIVNDDAVSPAPGSSPTSYGVTPTIHYHPNSQSATLDGSNRVLSCPDLMGLASLSGVSFGGSTVGPVEMTDALGRKFWRFSPAQYLLIANALAGLNHRQLCVFAVWRAHKVTRGEQVPLFSTRYSSYTDDSTNTNRSNGFTCAWNSSAGAGQSSVGRLFNGTVDAFSAASNAGKMIPPANLHVAGSNSRTTANGGGRFYINNDAADVAQSSLTGTADVGGIIGGKGAASNGVTATSTCFDLYEFALWKGTITNAQSDAMAAAMVSNWSIPTFIGQVILLGDSITECVDTATTTVIPSDNIAVTLTAPGAELVPTNFRVINAAVGGSGVVSEYTGLALVNQRDDANGPLKYVYPGGAANNIITCNIGINDMRSSSSPSLTAAAHYSNVVALINTTTTGYLQRGFSVVAVTPTAISGDGTGQGRILAYRDLLVDATTDLPVSQFLTDVQANVGQAYDGRVSVLPLCKIENGSSGTVFLNSTDAADTTYYSSDGTHHTTLGYQLQCEGGDTPQYGYAGLFDLVIPPAQFSLSGAVSQPEGNTGTTTWTYRIFRTGNLSGTASVDWTVQASGSNPTPTSRFSGGVYPSGVANFGDGVDFVDITFTSITDLVDQADETFTLVLANPTAASGTAKLTSPFNASGTILNDDAITGGPQIINLGSAAATEDFIRSGYGTEWVATGTATQTKLVATTPAQLLTHWNTVKNAANTFSERWEIECDWDGMLTYTTSEASFLSLFGKKNTTQGWADNGGWVKIYGKAGKRPGIANRIKVMAWRGVEISNLILAGTWDGATYANGSGKQNAQGCLLNSTNSTYPAEPIVNVRDCAFGRMFVASATNSDYSICGILCNGLSEQITVTNCSLEGTYFAMSLLARKTRVSGNDIHKSNGDYIQLNGHTKKSGYYAYAIIEYNTERGPIQSLAYRSLHQDGCQTGATKDIHLGYRVLLKGNRWHLDHMYQGLPGLGGGTNGSYNDDYLNADNLFCLRENSIHAASPHSFTYHSPKATYRSYVERCNLGRCGRVPSQFTGDTYPPEDYSPGLMGNAFKPTLPGIALTVVDSLIGSNNMASDPQIQVLNSVIVDYRIGGTITPEMVYNGANFERGGANTSNSIAGKFGCIFPHEQTGTQAELLGDFNANYTPQGVYASKGAPAAVLSNYAAVGKPAWAT